MSIEITLWPSLRDPHGSRHRTSWPALCARLAGPTVTDDKTAAWEQRVRWVARVEAHKRRWRPTADPCEVEIALRGLNPRSDVDNAAKAVLDALNGLAWDDDRRVWSLLVRRDETLAADGALVIVRRAGELEEGARA